MLFKDMLSQNQTLEHLDLRGNGISRGEQSIVAIDPFVRFQIDKKYALLHVLSKCLSDQCLEDIFITICSYLIVPRTFLVHL